jgi:predicted  nucleic acid-binding Zn-ribbon protein
MKPTVQDLLEVLSKANTEISAVTEKVGGIEAALKDAKQELDRVQRAGLNAEQALRDAIRVYVGGPGQIL